MARHRRPVSGPTPAELLTFSAAEGLPPMMGRSLGGRMCGGRRRAAPIPRRTLIRSWGVCLTRCGLSIRCGGG
jgi:hypothetical protein